MHITITEADDIRAREWFASGNCLYNISNNCVVAQAIKRQYADICTNVFVYGAKMSFNGREYEVPETLKAAINDFDLGDWEKPFTALGTFELVPA